MVDGLRREEVEHTYRISFAPAWGIGTEATIAVFPGAVMSACIVICALVVLYGHRRF